MTENSHEKERQTQIGSAAQSSECDHSNRGGGLEAIGGESSTVGDNSLQADSALSQNITERTGQTPLSGTTGKMLSQLRNIRAAHLAYVKAHEERLRARLDENLTHQEKVFTEIDNLEKEILRLFEEEN
ncbi:hypothetical protein [Cylindrospermum sp. FACHB-282]|uniref:hypothetical protein n=1 Tax=Cylindrospermum sp. FACHB-282 TaxID=2692794 RepID=UPI001683FB6B|nr:hypothetical protein [Cylindrospermum sp. FACHB-282]MBD2386924.1 hypothetical protein [Cylindrospermum sp. FACHB-282]